MAAAASSAGLSETDIEREPAAAAQKLTAALEQNPGDPEYYCQRAYAYILLQNYHDAITDAQKALSLDPNNAVAFLRQGIGEYYLKNYTSALKSFTEGQEQDGADSAFPVWMKRCEEALGASGSQAETAWPSKIKYDWYQTDSHVIVTIMIKQAKHEDVNITFSEKELKASLKFSSDENYKLNLHLLHSIVPEQSLFKILSTKIEIKMKKPEVIRWEKLEGQENSADLKKSEPASNPTLHYPSSSHHTKNWDKLVGEIKEEEKNEKLEGDAALNKLFQQIYSDGTDEVKRAMNKSFVSDGEAFRDRVAKLQPKTHLCIVRYRMESGGTVLSTNWSDVGKRKVEVNPPEDMEWKKF